MNILGKKVPLWILIPLLILAAPFIYNIDAFTGHYKFKRLCREQGGVRFYGPVERNQGWLAEGNSHGVRTDDAIAKKPFLFGDIDFVRYKDRRGRLTDMKLAPVQTSAVKSYDQYPADPSKSPRYGYTDQKKYLPDDKRFLVFRVTITDLRDQSKLAELVVFSFAWAESDRMILGMSTLKQCEASSGWYEEFFGEIYNQGELK